MVKTFLHSDYEPKNIPAHYHIQITDLDGYQSVGLHCFPIKKDANISEYDNKQLYVPESFVLDAKTIID